MQNFKKLHKSKINYLIHNKMWFSNLDICDPDEPFWPVPEEFNPNATDANTSLSPALASVLCSIPASFSYSCSRVKTLLQLTFDPWLHEMKDSLQGDFMTTFYICE